MTDPQDVGIQLAVVALILGVVFILHKLAKGLYVEGSANEWVLIIRNGRMVKAGVGLSCFRGPMDQVARFPSKVNKVTFMSDQMTQEKQGVRVTGMLVWTINRMEDGPMKAFKNLGEDLASDNPRQANEHLVELGNAILRNQIANSTIDEIMTNRRKLRDAIRHEMMEVVHGWGVWLETVEITEVMISSNELFKNMQSEFREEQNRKAQIKRMDVNRDIDQLRLNKDTLMQKIRSEANNQRQRFEAQIRLDWEKDQERIFKQNKIVEKDKLEADQDLSMHWENVVATKDKQRAELRQDTLVHTNQMQMEKEASRRGLLDAKFLTSQMVKKHELALEEALQTHNRKMKEENYRLMARNMNDKMMKVKALDTVRDVYCSMSLGGYSMVQMGGEQDIVAGMLGKMTAMVESEGAAGAVALPAGGRKV